VAEQARAGDSPDVAEEPSAGTGLRSSLALEIATYMIHTKQAGLHYLTHGLPEDPEVHRIALAVLVVLVRHLSRVVYWNSFGMRVGTEWLRPPPARLVAQRLGIGPSAS
jgi:hypothetical protein